jgi:hypothetical protein
MIPLWNEIKKQCDAKNIKINLQGADLWGANLRRANLRRANLREANLQGAYLANAALEEADLTYADLRGANLKGVDLSFANLKGAKGVFCIYLKPYSIRCTKNQIQIGGEIHSVSQWKSYKKKRIKSMDNLNNAWHWWKQNKKAVLAVYKQFQKGIQYENRKTVDNRRV